MDQEQEDHCESLPTPVISTQPRSSDTTTLTVPDAASSAAAKRRSSMPTESLLIVGRSGTGGPTSGGSSGKSSRSRKRILRRRSSGGADILNPVLAEETAFSAWTAGKHEVEKEKQEMVVEVQPKGEMKHSLSWFRLKREGSVRKATDKEALLSRRRGSLPIEVLAFGHSGEDSLLFSGDVESKE